MILLDIFLGLAGLVFCSLGIAAYLIPGIENFQRDQVEFGVASIMGTEWHHAYPVDGHPLLFALRILLDMTGAVGAIGIGLFAFGVLISAHMDNTQPLIRKLEAVAIPWITTALLTYGAHFVLMLFLYFMSFGIIEIR